MTAEEQNTVGIILVSILLVLLVGAIYFGREDEIERKTRSMQIENCKITCHPNPAEWLPITETCLCKVSID